MASIAIRSPCAGPPSSSSSSNGSSPAGSGPGATAAGPSSGSTIASHTRRWLSSSAYILAVAKTSVRQAVSSPSKAGRRRRTVTQLSQATSSASATDTTRR